MTVQARHGARILWTGLRALSYTPAQTGHSAYRPPSSDTKLRRLCPTRSPGIHDASSTSLLFCPTHAPTALRHVCSAYQCGRAANGDMPTTYDDLQTDLLQSPWFTPCVRPCRFHRSAPSQPHAFEDLLLCNSSGPARSPRWFRNAGFAVMQARTRSPLSELQPTVCPCGGHLTPAVLQTPTPS